MDFCKEFCKKSWKKIILGTSDAWSTIRLSHRPSDPAYYIVNWRISIFSRVISGVLCQNGQIETGDIYVLAAGIMVNPLGRTIGVNLPIYPLKGNVVTVPLKVIYNVLSAIGSMMSVWEIEM